MVNLAVLIGNRIGTLPLSLLARRPRKLVSSSLFAKRRYWIACSAGGTRSAYRFPDHQRRLPPSRMECLSLRGAWACCHLPQVATPVVVGAGVLAAVDPDLVVEDDRDR
jgi:hypothetical protein